MLKAHDSEYNNMIQKYSNEHQYMYAFNPLQPGIQNGRYEKPVCITLKKLIFDNIFFKKV